jgi:hypothetical protein
MALLPIVLMVGLALVNMDCGGSKGNPPLLRVYGSDMSDYYENVYVDSYEGVAIVDAQVTVNGTTMPYNSDLSLYNGTLNSTVPVGGSITLEVTSGASTVTATGTIPEPPVLTTPSNNATFKSTDNITVTWTSSTNPDYFDVSAGYSCWRVQAMRRQRERSRQHPGQWLSGLLQLLT